MRVPNLKTFIFLSSSQLQPRKCLKRKSVCASRFEVAGLATRVNEVAHDAELLFAATDAAVSRPTAGARLFFTLACIVNISETYARTFTRSSAMIHHSTGGTGSGGKLVFTFFIYSSCSVM